MANKRIDFYDFIKGLLMLGIVFGHFLNAFSAISSSDSTLHLLVRTYDLPMFMVLGGVLLKKSIDNYSIQKLILRKVSKVARPTIILGGIMAVLFSLITKKVTLINIFNYIKGIWFMWSYFFCIIIVIVFAKLLKNKKAQLIVLCGIQLIFHFLPVNPWNMNFMFPFFVIGFFLPDFIYRYKKIVDNVWIKYISFLMYLILFSFWNSTFTIWSSNGLFLYNSLNTILISVYRFSIGLFGCICAYYIMRMLYNTFGAGFRNEICRYGKESMSIYIIHSFIVSTCFSMALRIICNKIPMISEWITNNYRFIIIFAAPVLSFIICALIYRLVTFIKKSKAISSIVFGS